MSRAGTPLDLALAAVEPDAELGALLDEPLLDADERTQASQVLQRFAGLPEVTGFVHGDLAPVNLRRRPGPRRGGVRPPRPATGQAGPARPLQTGAHATMFPLTGAVSALRQGGDPAKFLAWFRRRCAVREHPPAG